MVASGYKPRTKVTQMTFADDIREVFARHYKAPPPPP